MDINDVKDTIELIENSRSDNKQENILSSIFLDDNIFLNDSTLTKSCILFDNVKVNHINPNVYIRTIYKNFDFEKARALFNISDKIKFVETFYGNVENYNFVNFININKSLVEEGVLIPHVFHKLPVISIKSDSDILLGILNDMTEEIFTLANYFNLKRERDIFCIDEPLLYTLKMICIQESFLEAIANNKIVISEKKEIVKYAFEHTKNLGNIRMYNERNLHMYNYDVDINNIQRTMNNLIFDTFNILVPNFPNLKSDEILEVRYKLKDELGAYRLLIKDTLKKYESNNEISNSEIIQKEIENKINDINLKIKCEKGKLFRNIVMYATAFPTASGILTGGEVKSIIASCFGSLVKVGCDVNKYYTNKKMLMKQSDNLPYIFLIKARKMK